MARAHVRVALPALARRLPAEQPGKEDAEPDGDADVDQPEEREEHAHHGGRVLVLLHGTVAIGVEDRLGPVDDQLEVEQQRQRQRKPEDQPELRPDQPQQPARAAARRGAREARHHLRAPQQHQLEQHVGRRPARCGAHQKQRYREFSTVILQARRTCVFLVECVSTPLLRRKRSPRQSI